MKVKEKRFGLVNKSLFLNPCLSVLFVEDNNDVWILR